jgi:crotonobetainyl-CoA:carnitine CoA-transferase CaiB-like acyl-CoA transferase
MTLEEKIAARRSTVDAFVQTLDSLEKLDEAMKTINIAWGEIRNPVDISNQPTIASRNSIVQMDDREGGTRPITQSPYRFSNAESGVRGPAPHRGEHNVEILSDWLGLSPAEISSLQTEDVILFDADWKHH